MSAHVKQQHTLLRTAWLCFIAVLSIAITAGCSAETKNTQEEAIEQFENAVKNKNVDEFMKVAVSMDKLYELTKEDAKQYIDFLNEEEDRFEWELERLDGMAAGIPVDHPYDGALLYLSYSESKWGSGEYKIGIQPSYISVYTNLKDTNIYMNDAVITQARHDRYSKVIGPLSPGEYKLRAEFEKYASPERTISLPLESRGNVDLTVAAQKITFGSNYEDAELYLNGASTGMTIAEARQNPQLLATDGSITAQAKYVQNDLVLESEPVTITGSNSSYYLELPDEYVYLSSSISGAQVYANNKPFGLISDNDPETEIGPLAPNTTVRLRAEIDSPWGRLSSYETEVYVEQDGDNYGSTWFTLQNEEMTKSIDQAIVAFVQSGFRANREYDYSQFQNVTSAMREDALYMFNGSFASDAMLTGLRIYTGETGIYGSVNGSAIAYLTAGPIYMDVDYGYVSYYGDFVDGTQRFGIAVQYNTTSGQWEVSSMNYESSWWDMYDSNRPDTLRTYQMN